MTVQLTQEQFQELLGRISAIHSSANKNFTQCTLRFHGEHDYNKVDLFIHAVTAFKQLEKIPDEDALFGLPLLLKDAASTWWAGVRSEVNSWTEALHRIRLNYTPPHEIYMLIFTNPQDSSEATDKFLSTKKKLLALLPAGRHSEEVQLDFIYGLLKLGLRNEIPRSEFKTFAELEDRVRLLESREKSAKLKAIQPPITKRPKKRCTFCRYKGHTIEVCKKRMIRMAEELNGQSVIADTWKTSAKSKADSPMSPTSTVDSPISTTRIMTDSPASPPMISDSPASPPTVSDSPASPPPMAADSSTSTIVNHTKTVPMAFSPMSPTTDDEEPSIFCFGCGAPNVWKSICAKCKNT